MEIIGCPSALLSGGSHNKDLLTLTPGPNLQVPPDGPRVWSELWQGAGAAVRWSGVSRCGPRDAVEGDIGKEKSIPGNCSSDSVSY